MKFITESIFLTGAVLVFVSAQNAVPRDSTLDAIDSLYTSGYYLDAELEARRFSEKPGITDSMKTQIDKWIAFSLIAQEKTTLARERFLSIFSRDPSFELDPVLTSPKILSVFNDAKSEFRSQKKSNIAVPGVMYRDHNEQISFRAIVFPGWEQLHQGRETEGYVFVSAGSIALAGGIAFEFLRSDARKRYLNATVSADIKSKYDTYNTMRKAEIYSFVSFAAIYIASEMDIFLVPHHDVAGASGISLAYPLVGFSIPF